MYNRNIQAKIEIAMSDTPVIFLRGARQIGKTTLARQLIRKKGGIYLTFDDPALLNSASDDPGGFLDAYDDFPLVCIDEAQLVPNLFRAIKKKVDENRRPGHFLLTGSADVMALPNISESLAGRMELLTMWPLSQGEIHGRCEDFIDIVFSGKAPKVTARENLNTRITKGGFPEVLARKKDRREEWFQSYVIALMQRDIRNLSRVEGLIELPRILQLLGTRNGGLINYSSLARDARIAETTLKRYLALLQMIFMYQPLPAWFSNRGKRLVKASKCYLLDSGLTAFLSSAAAKINGGGDLLETFVVGELRKQASWSNHPVELFHFRTANGNEVDIVMEDRNGRIVGIEIKSSTTVDKRDFSGLHTLAETAGKRFVQGIVLYQGEHVAPFGPGFRAVPVQALWQNEKKRTAGKVAGAQTGTATRRRHGQKKTR